MLRKQVDFASENIGNLIHSLTRFEIAPSLLPARFCRN